MNKIILRLEREHASLLKQMEAINRYSTPISDLILEKALYLTHGLDVCEKALARFRHIESVSQLKENLSEGVF